MLITDPRRGPGPPQKGETFYFAKDSSGELRTFTLGTKEEKDADAFRGKETVCVWKVSEKEIVNTIMRSPTLRYYGTAFIWLFCEKGWRTILWD